MFEVTKNMLNNITSQTLLYQPVYKTGLKLHLLLKIQIKPCFFLVLEKYNFPAVFQLFSGCFKQLYSVL